MTYCEQNEGYRVQVGDKVHFLLKSDGWTPRALELLDEIVSDAEVIAHDDGYQFGYGIACGIGREEG